MYPIVEEECPSLTTPTHGLCPDTKEAMFFALKTRIGYGKAFAVSTCIGRDKGEGPHAGTKGGMVLVNYVYTDVGLPAPEV